MKTTIETPNENELEEGTQKALALKKFNNEPFYLRSIDGEIKAFDGEDPGEEFSLEDATEIEPIEGDEERDNYIVLTDEEADEKAKESILQSVWAFTPNFLASFTGFDISIFEAIQNNNKCEDNNDAILSMVKDEDEFVSEAIRWDGRGHFMSSYDGHENEESVGGVTYYIYRMN
jgi:hypothetical protein